MPERHIIYGTIKLDTKKDKNKIEYIYGKKGIVSLK